MMLENEKLPDNGEETPDRNAPGEHFPDDAENTDAETNENTAEMENEAEPEEQEEEQHENTIRLSGLYKNWFLDYASYVILERAVPSLHDGLKPVQRRILHSMKEMEDGRYNKVANIIGNTMKYHPHGDASIGDALVQIGQKDLLIDMQGNWGNTLTGDAAAAARYIEARLTRFANEVVFNPKTTEWQASYDGRNNEPVHLPVKFPLLLAQGGEGIAVGLACKFMPHNFIELIDGAIDVLRGKKPSILPDFPNGGMADFTQYNDGLRGGKVRVRSRISKADKKTLVITEIPYGTITTSLIDSILKANEKGKIKIRKIEDNTANVAEILVHLPSGISPDKTIDALYAFTDCEVSISPNSCTIENDKPVFIGVSSLLQKSVERTVDLLQLELNIKKQELQEKWHFASLEKIFIENRVYRDIEEEETWKGVMDAIDKGVHKYISTPGRKSKRKGTVKLVRDVTEEDLTRLTEIRIKRISKFDSDKADEWIGALEKQLTEIQHHLDYLVEYAIAYYKGLKEKFSAGKERKTEIKTFDTISAQRVIVSNKKLYINRKEGFMGWSLKKDELVSDCSELDDVIVFFGNGSMMVTRIAEKKFVGKNIIHSGLWKKGDTRTIYHMIYQDGKEGPAMMKRFPVKSITRDKLYDLTKGNKGSKLLYFSANPNGEREVVTVQLRLKPHLRRVKFDIDFGQLAIKSRGVAGNRVTKEPVSKVTRKEVGGSTLAARKIWFDDVVGRLNDEGRGRLLGAFKGNDRVLSVYANGTYRLTHFNLSQRFDDGLKAIEKWDPERSIAVVYWDQGKALYYIKRFRAEPPFDKPVGFIGETEGNVMVTVQTNTNPRIKIVYSKRYKETKFLPDKEFAIKDFIEVKGVKAQGNQLTKLAVKSIGELPPQEGEDPTVEELMAKEHLTDPVVGQEKEKTGTSVLSGDEGEEEQGSLF